MALVHMEHVRGEASFDGGERADCPHTADAGEEFLFDAVFLIAAVQPVGDVTQIVIVLRNVGIQQ